MSETGCQQCDRRGWLKKPIIQRVPDTPVNEGYGPVQYETEDGDIRDIECWYRTYRVEKLIVFNNGQDAKVYRGYERVPVAVDEQLLWEWVPCGSCYATGVTWKWVRDEKRMRDTLYIDGAWVCDMDWFLPEHARNAILMKHLSYHQKDAPAPQRVWTTESWAEEQKQRCGA